MDRLTADRAYRALHDRIAEGAIAPGDRLREAALAEEFGLSRTPVREALRRLESDGLLLHEPHRGMVVRTLDHQAVTELYLIRGVLEATAAALAARHASDAEIDTLYEMVDAQEGVAGGAEAARLNKLFHRALYRGAHNRYLLDMLDGLATSMTLLGRTTLSLPGRAADAHGEHRAIVDALRAHDPDAAERAAREHIHAAHRARLKIMFDDERATEPAGEGGSRES